MLTKVSIQSGKGFARLWTLTFVRVTKSGGQGDVGLEVRVTKSGMPSPPSVMRTKVSIQSGKGFARGAGP